MKIQTMLVSPDSPLVTNPAMIDQSRKAVKDIQARQG